MSFDIGPVVNAFLAVAMLAGLAGTAVANFRANKNKQTLAEVAAQLGLMQVSNAELRAQLVDARSEAAELRGQMQFLSRDFAEVIAKAVIDVIPKLWGHDT